MSLTVAPIQGTPFIGGSSPGDLTVDASGNQSLVRSNIGTASTPTVNDDTSAGYSVGSRWWTTGGALYYCDDASVGAAVWTQVNPVSSGLTAADIDTLAELNAIVGDATLIDTSDARLSDARTPTAHNHAASDVTSGTFAEDRGGTNQSTYAAGDILYASATNTLSKLAKGTDTQVLTLASGLPSWATPSGGGLTKFTEAESTSSPNATVYVDSLTAAGASTDVDFAIIPKGAGAIIASIPNGADTGGNKRGSLSLDLQRTRTVNSHVASGYQAAILSGHANTSSGLRAAVVGGEQNLASGSYSTAMGSYNTASADSATATGYNGTASGAYATTRGRQAKADKYGQDSLAGGLFSVVGDAQTSVLVGRIATTDATPGELFLNGASARCTIANDTTWAFTITVVARRTDADNESAAYKFEGCIDNNAGTTALVGSVTKTVIAEDTAAWDCDVTASDTYDALIITVTGEAAKTIRWVARIELTEVSG